MSNKNKWEALSMKDRAFLIRQAVKNGITDIGSIRDTWEHRFDGNSNHPTEDEYIAQKSREVRDLALSKARNRKTLESPIIGYEDPVEVYRNRISALQEDLRPWEDNLLKAEAELKEMASSGEFNSVIDRKTAHVQALRDVVNDKRLNLNRAYKMYPEGKDPIPCYGANCIYTVTKDYGRPVSGNMTFMENHEEKGFKKIPVDSIKPGDLVQFGRDVPRHAMMANTAYTEDVNNMRYNGSNGEAGKDAIRINSKYPVDSWDDVTAYRYVGNSADSLQWKNEYSQRYGHRFGGDESNDPGFFKSLVNIFKPKPKPAPTSEWPTSYEELPDPIRKIVQNAATKYNYTYDDIADLYNSGKMNAPLSAVYQYAPSGRVRDNDVAATKEASEDLEKNMNIYMYNVYPKSHGQASPNMAYAIPYIESEEIRVPGVGRVPKNALDSLAKYAAKVKIPLYEAVGLAAQETALGAIPIYNYKAIPKNATEEEKQKVRDYNRALGNSSYFRNYGIIPAEHLVRDFRYNNYPIDRNIPPLEHAFTYWKKGNYNRGDRNHTRDVRAKGRKVMSSDIMKEWAKHSKYAQQALKNNLD